MHFYYALVSYLNILGIRHLQHISDMQLKATSFISRKKLFLLEPILWLTSRKRKSINGFSDKVSGQNWLLSCFGFRKRILISLRLSSSCVLFLLFWVWYFLRMTTKVEGKEIKSGQISIKPLVRGKESWGQGGWTNLLTKERSVTDNYHTITSKEHIYNINVISLLLDTRIYTKLNW